MATAFEITDVDLSQWISGTRFFGTSDDTYFVIDSDFATYPSFVKRVIRRNTAVFYCNPDATVTDLVPDREFPPQTTAEEAIAALGYTLETP